MLIFDCNVNTAIFNCWIEQDLISKLPNDFVVVIDNASFHKHPHFKNHDKRVKKSYMRRLDYIMITKFDIRHLSKLDNDVKWCYKNLI
ncbi:Uncharacterised protein [Orientia tsutsugamushi]|uniref:IS630 family transposase n=2 Tax=Orientia tsutsugamushi TaxID=784 RepID=A0A0F3P909_ORITS|nr:hypothetical protein OTSTA716_0996 [Orientia tsutsugamushi str. TA716]KJV77088.1 hypothetical protein OTSTA716_0449 [Orientia tsutsugamushi str. TA716]SPM46116.1 Uncharacterised protein [Orientia tsutsugamushi]